MRTRRFGNNHGTSLGSLDTQGLEAVFIFSSPLPAIDSGGSCDGLDLYTTGQGWEGDSE